MFTKINTLIILTLTILQRYTISETISELIKEKNVNSIDEYNKSDKLDYYEYKKIIQKEIEDLDAEYIKKDTIKMMYNSNPDDPMLEAMGKTDPEQFKLNLVQGFKAMNPMQFDEQAKKRQQKYEGLDNSENVDFGTGQVPEQLYQNYGFEPKMKVDMNFIKKKLTEKQYVVTQFSSSEHPGSGKYIDHFEKGKYNCIVCDENLFSSVHKYKTKKGFAAFHSTIGDLYEQNLEFGKIITAKCENCGSYLGDIVRNDPESKTGKSYLINSSSVIFESGIKLIE